MNRNRLPNSILLSENTQESLSTQRSSNSNWRPQLKPCLRSYAHGLFVSGTDLGRRWVVISFAFGKGLPE
jgi:hypothetical protein